MDIKLSKGDECQFCHVGKTNPNTGERTLPYSYIYDITGYNWTARLCESCLNKIASFRDDCQKIAEIINNKPQAR